MSLWSCCVCVWVGLGRERERGVSKRGRRRKGGVGVGVGGRRHRHQQSENARVARASWALATLAPSTPGWISARRRPCAAAREAPVAGSGRMGRGASVSGGERERTHRRFFSRARKVLTERAEQKELRAWNCVVLLEEEARVGAFGCVCGVRGRERGRRGEVGSWGERRRALSRPSLLADRLPPWLAARAGRPQSTPKPLHASTSRP